MSSILSLVNDEQSLRAYRTAALTAQTPHLLKQQLDAAFITPNRLGMFQDLGGSEPEALQLPVAMEFRLIVIVRR